MSTLNLDPITKTDRPTSDITVREQQVGTADVAAIEHQGVKAYFYVDTIRDPLQSELRNQVLIHENAVEVFGGIARGSPFLVHTDVSTGNIPACDSAKLYAENVDTDRLVAHLTDERFLLHRGIEEVAQINGTFVPFNVVSVEPLNYTTVGITEETDIEFVSAEEARKQERETPGRRSPGGEGAPSSETGEMDVEIEIAPEVPTVSFEEDVAGLSEVKETARMLLALFDPETQQSVKNHYGENFASRGGSMLLYGPPGCGKTLVSEAIAYEAANNTRIEEEYGDVKFLPVKGSDILSRYPGEAERRVEAVFDKAHSIAQEGFAVLFFDEIETLIPDRGDDDLQRHERSLTNAFLQEMDTDKIEDNLLVIGATNMPFTIDPAASRRFPVQQFIPQPGAEVMTEVWRKELSTLESANSDIRIDYNQLGENSVGYTPAEIADRVLGTEFQRELVQSIVDDDREPITPNTEYLLDRLEQNEPKTVRQYIASVRDETDALEGYPAMRDYVEDQAEQLGMALPESGSGGGQTPFDFLEQIASASESTEEPERE